MPGSDESIAFRLLAVLFFSYETQRRAIWLSYGVVGTSYLLNS
jgi:hypothetical protein